MVTAHNQCYHFLFKQCTFEGVIQFVIYSKTQTFHMVYISLQIARDAPRDVIHWYNDADSADDNHLSYHKEP